MLGSYFSDYSKKTLPYLITLYLFNIGASFDKKKNIGASIVGLDTTHLGLSSDAFDVKWRLIVWNFLYLVVDLFQWLARELALLQNQIDRANEKGWRREYPFKISSFIFHNMLPNLQKYCPINFELTMSEDALYF